MKALSRSPSMEAPPLLKSLILLVLSLTSAADSPIDNLQKAAEVLSNNHFSSMGLVLDLISETDILPSSPSLTIFSSRDSAFSRSGQPSLSLLQLHFSPIFLSSQFLRSLPFGTEIPTVLDNRSLIVTTLPGDARVSLNDVRITNSPLYSDDSLVIFGAEDFFNSSFQLPFPIQGHGTPNLRCASSIKNSKKMLNFKADDSFERASKVMKSSGYSVMASILGMQLVGIEKPATLLTIFAPIDESVVKVFRNFGEYPSMFLQHAVPCRLLWGDLVDMENGEVAIPTYRKGFKINVTRSNDNKVLLVNKIPIIRPELYKNEWVVVHGVRSVLGMTARKSGGGDKPPSHSTPHSGNGEKGSPADKKDFKVMIAFSMAMLVPFF
ncbi:hypothetical protein SAY86_002520 [Trapa natans]|uniref:FAS1 domain-containing protein n=1 Tax=Trapa natans TaxID=22666 RepID=A0AAN7LG34_TRANT|nr:hypothetical protein SAY86_002520 [Trapa natans]